MLGDPWQELPVGEVPVEQAQRAGYQRQTRVSL
jgi:hypothetical protein